MDIATPEEVLAFWFAPGRQKHWYANDARFDKVIRERFLATHEAACSGTLNDWRKKPRSLLALIIVLDQFSRNMFRGTARAFAADAQALSLTKEGVERGYERAFRGVELDFFTMPLMHSEASDDHDLLIKLGCGDNRYAREHREVIRRFARFPTRNQALGRQNTAEEEAFLAARRRS